MVCVVAAPGDHEYVPPGNDGVAFSVAFCPAQIDDEFTVTVGTAFTVTVAFAVPVPVDEHPDNVQLTVQIVVAVGETVIAGVVSPPGNHE